jgi:hypothetical protein
MSLKYSNLLFKKYNYICHYMILAAVLHVAMVIMI